ncbi:5' nucleotidase, NT5C type [Heyndrickxia sp. NPDC080065]|uniref:5' nucleotidase, NT5C type n=1 Tax=Heyndrickxia sp. NPDC080065 TaxID=3390568 RepID=UPI003D0408D0
MKKRFGIDIDGTVTHPNSLLPYINEAFQLQLTLDDITEYELTNVINVPEKKFYDWFIKTEPKIYAESPLAIGAKEVLTKWKEQFQLYFISARASNLLEVTEKWFTENDIKYNHIELIGSHHKVETAKKYHVDLFFEDKHDNAVMIHQELNIPVILFDTPYNQDPIPEGVIRVKSWKEAELWVRDWIKRE